MHLTALKWTSLAVHHTHTLQNARDHTERNGTKTKEEINVRQILKLEWDSYFCTLSSLQNILYYSKYYLTNEVLMWLVSPSIWATKGSYVSWWKCPYHPCRWLGGCEGEPEGCCCEGPPSLCLPVGYKAAVCLAGLRTAAVWPLEMTPHEPWWSAAGTEPEHVGAALPCHPHSADYPAWRLLASTHRMRVEKIHNTSTLLCCVGHMVSHIQYLISIIAKKHLFLRKLQLPLMPRT